MEDSAFDKTIRDSFHSIVLFKICMEKIEVENRSSDFFFNTITTFAWTGKKHSRTRIFCF
jgi:hypothetical protein